MLQWLVSFLTTPLLNGLLEGWKAKLASQNTQDAKATELAVEELKADIEARKIASATIIAEQGRWWTALPRAIVQWSFAIFVAKCVVWDKVLGFGSTDPLGGDIQAWAGWVMVAWFGGRSLEKVAQVFKGRG